MHAEFRHSCCIAGTEQSAVRNGGVREPVIIEVCSQKRAVEKAAEAREKLPVISITSTDEPDVAFDGNRNVGPVLHLKLNDLTQEYDEEGIPYGRPLPTQEDLEGLKEFAAGLSGRLLIIHCWEGTSRSAALASAIFEFRGRRDIILTHQAFEPNPLVAALARSALGICSHAVI